MDQYSPTKISDSGRPSSRAETTRFRTRRAYLRNKRLQPRPDGSIHRLSELIPDLRDQFMPVGGGAFKQKRDRQVTVSVIFLFFNLLCLE